MRTLILLNPHSCGGQAGKIFRRVEEKLYRILGKFLIAITHDPTSVVRYLDLAAQAGIERIIVLGGDGTNNSVINALAQRHELDLEFATIPMGTGRDWARSLGIPTNPLALDSWLGHIQPVRCDIGQVDYLDAQNGGKQTSRVFLNVSSMGISHDVISRVNQARRHTATSFLTSSLKALIQYEPKPITVECDGNKFFEGLNLMFVVANGRSFGRGMCIAPDALLNDGLFDVIAIEWMPRFKAMRALPSLYAGTHIRRREIHYTKARSVRVRSLDGPLELDFDGEEALGNDVRFTVMPRALKILLDPSHAAVMKTQ